MTVVTVVTVDSLCCLSDPLEVGVSIRWTSPSSSLFFTLLLFVIPSELARGSVETTPSSSCL